MLNGYGQGFQLRFFCGNKVSRFGINQPIICKTVKPQQPLNLKCTSGRRTVSKVPQYTIAEFASHHDAPGQTGLPKDSLVWWQVHTPQPQG